MPLHIKSYVSFRMINRPNHLNRFYHVQQTNDTILENSMTLTHIFDLDGTLVDSSEGIPPWFVQTNFG